MSKSKKIKMTKEQMQAEGYYFTVSQIDHIVSEASKIGFIPLPRFAKRKAFDATEIEGSLSLRHIKSDSLITVELYMIKSLGLDIFKENMADLLFTLLFKEIDDQSYADNYHP